MPEELENHADIDPLVEHLWRHFLTLHKCRGSNGFGPSAISYRDIKDWMELTGNKLLPWEVDAIIRADGAFLEVQAEVAAAERARKK